MFPTKSITAAIGFTSLGPWSRGDTRPRSWAKPRSPGGVTVGVAVGVGVPVAVAVGVAVDVGVNVVVAVGVGLGGTVAVAVALGLLLQSE